MFSSARNQKLNQPDGVVGCLSPRHGQLVVSVCYTDLYIDGGDPRSAVRWI